MTIRKFWAFAAVTLGSLFILHQCSFADDKPKNPFPRDYHDPYPQFIIRGGNEDTQLQEVFFLTQQANSGNPIAQYELGLYYLLGIGTVPDTVKAAYWTKKAAEQHHAVASYNMSVFYVNAWGVPWNPFEAYKNIRFAATAGLTEAQYYLCRFLMENLVVPRDLKQAYYWVKLAADSGFVPAKEIAAEFLKRGWANQDNSDSDKEGNADEKNTGASQSKSKFQPVFLDFSHDTVAHVDDQTLVREALDATDSKRNAGNDSIKAFRDSIVVDSTMRRTIFQNARDGSPEALVIAARWIQNGDGMKKDVVLAAAHYIRAMRLDSPRAPRLLWEMIQDAKFFTQLKSRVDGGDPVAQYVWAELIALGFDHQLTDAQAWELLQSAAKKQYEPAFIESGMNYFLGFWVKKDERKALKLWSEAAKLGSREARLRVITVETVGVPDASVSKESIGYLMESEKAGSVLAQAMLGYCCESGVGLPRNKIRAAHYYRDAAQRGSQIAYNGLLRMYDEIRPKEKEFELGQ